MLRQRKPFYFVLATLCLAACGHSWAVRPAFAGDRPALNLAIDNDTIGGDTDGHYSNGLLLTYQFADSHQPGFAKQLARLLLAPDSGDSAEISISLGQAIFTPGNINLASLIEDDRPYAGWLFTQLTMRSRSGRSYDSLLLNIGVVGPAALADETQSQWHRLFALPKPRGWRNQLKNEPALLIAYDRQWRLPPQNISRKLTADLTPHAGISLGNVFTYATGGLMLRLGTHLPEAPEPPRILPAPMGSAGFTARPDMVDWYLFVGLTGRVVGRNIFLDGNTYRDSHSVAKEHLVWDFEAGLSTSFFLGRRPTRIAYSFIVRSEEFKLQKSPDKFASISVALTF